MKKKIYLVLIVALVSLFVFVGCSKKEDSQSAINTTSVSTEDSSTTKKGSGIKLTIWNSAQSMADFYNNTVTPAFLEKYPEVESVEVLYMPIQDFVKRLAVVLPAGDVPDIMEIEDSWATPYVTAGYFEPNTPELDAILAKMEPSLTNSVTYEGKTYGVPSAPFHELFYWNVDMLKEAGYDSVPDTWDEVLDAAIKMTKRDENGNITVSGFSMRLGGNPNGTTQKFWVLALLSNGVNLWEESKTEPGKYHAGFDNEGGYNALKMYIDMLYKYKVDDFASMKDTEAFANGKTAINMREASSALSIAKQGPDINWTTSPMPKGNVQRATFLLSLNLYVPKDAKNKEYARKYIEMATSEEMYEVQTGQRYCYNPYICSDKTAGLDERLVPGFEMPEDMKIYNVPVHNAYDLAQTKVGEALPGIFADSSLVDNPEGIKKAVHKLAELVNDAYKEYDEYAE